MALRTVGLHKRYGGNAGPLVPALEDVNLEIQNGELVAVMGPSGSGKSTLLNILGCLDQPTEGHYLIDGRDVTGLSKEAQATLRNRQIGFVFQSFHLLPRMSAQDNVALPLVYADVPRKLRIARAREQLARVGLAEFCTSKPTQMSGGEQQRVAIARALVAEPSVLLADEPTGNLDSTTSRDIMGIFSSLNRDSGITIILVTHESEVARHARRLCRFLDGRLVYDGAPVF